MTQADPESAGLSLVCVVWWFLRSHVLRRCLNSSSSAQGPETHASVLVSLMYFPDNLGWPTAPNKNRQPSETDGLTDDLLIRSVWFLNIAEMKQRRAEGGDEGRVPERSRS